MTHDYLIVGGGIVGLAVAYQLKKRSPEISIALLEKETAPCRHQTGHNSGVLHSGIYYRPGSYKATLCRKGYLELVRFAKQHGVSHEICGKLIVATREEELPRLQTLLERGKKNGLDGLKLLESREIQELEPYSAGIQAIHVPQAGIIDFVGAGRKMEELLKAQGVDFHFGHRVTAFRDWNNRKLIKTNHAKFVTKKLITCAGLQSDRMARLDGLNPRCRIVPFRGDYFELTESSKNLVRNLIYPVPDPAFPFLGVHFTRMFDGSVECGPNAVLSAHREGYSKSAINPKDLWESLSYPGFQTLAQKHWRMGLGEMIRSFSKSAFVSALQNLIPAIQEAQLVPTTPGIRAQAITQEGKPVDDFLFARGENSLHVLNAPSPAATASLAIGSEIVDQVLGK